MRGSGRQSGMSLVEVLAALMIVGSMIYASMTLTNAAHSMTRINNDKEFATQKAISMLEEMKGLVQSNTGATAVILDRYDDGIVTNPVLTIQGTKLPTGSTTPATQPDDPISGNTPRGSAWIFERLIRVQRMPGQSNDVRLVNVKLYKNTNNGQVLLAEVSSVIRTLVTVMPPSQVYDVYCVAIENVPGWWVYMSNLVPFVKNAISDLQARNPGLVFRTHWIHTLAYGRDPEYTPALNVAADSTQDINSVYFYPGAMPTAAPPAPACCGDEFYYPPFLFHGHIREDGVDTNGYDAVKNPTPYAIADQYNHAMRYADEVALYNARRAANPSEEMTLRLLLDDMYARPQLYTNALVINLHGELLPLPPVRNYSDAARDPETAALQNVRVVTHPEQLRYTNADAVRLRVYSYLSDPNTPASILNVPITILINGANGWVPAAGDITGIHGGVDNDGNGAVDPYDAAPAAIPTCPAPQATQMCFAAGIAPNGTDTMIRLFNSPLRAPLDTATGRGLDYASRLYGLEYIPSPVEDLTTGAVPFSANLTSPVPLTKNTARWIINIPAAALRNDIVGTVQTRIGNQLTSGTLYPARDHPPNLSRTYFWRGSNTFVFGDPAANPRVPPALPITERYQFQGDPRHCPYADLKRPHLAGVFPAGPVPPAGSYESPLGMGYNRYFDDFEDGVYNGASSAQMIGPTPPTGGVPLYTISAATRVWAAKFNGGPTISVNLTTGGRTPAQIAADLNANNAFFNAATADVLDNRVRIVSRQPGGSVQFDTSVPNNCAAVFGYDNLARPAGAWVGWSYMAGGLRYGVRNDGVPGNAGWDSTPAPSAGLLDIDVNRYFELVRSGIIRSNALWTTMTGFSYYYVGLGGEIGYDAANGFANSVPVSTRPFTGAGGGWQYIDSITRNLGTGTYLVRDNGTRTWWSKPWIGEIYPDSSYNTGGIDWMSSGNLPTGSGANTFVRDLRGNFPLYSGTKLTQSVRRTNVRGSTDFFWAGAANATFHHTYGAAPDTGTMQPAGTDIANNYAFPVPNTIDSNRPFNINVNNAPWNPDGFLQPAAYPPANVLTILNSYYVHNSGLQSSALVTVRDPATWDPSFVVVNGLSPTGVSGTTFIAKWSFLSLIQSYFNGGLYTDASASPTAHHIRQLPRLAITSPNVNTNLTDPSSINVGWAINWMRWDNKPYAAAYPAGYSETLTMKYAVLYSTTNGMPDASKNIETGWFYMSDDTTAYPGQKPDAQHEVTSTSTIWSTPAAKFPEGNYLIRVEAFREGYPQHYSYHQFRAFIKR
jgi:type II secretory pathway pseudopilin PulG